MAAPLPALEFNLLIRVEQLDRIGCDRHHPDTAEEWWIHGLVCRTCSVTFAMQELRPIQLYVNQITLDRRASGRIDRTNDKARFALSRLVALAMEHKDPAELMIEAGRRDEALRLTGWEFPPMWMADWKSLLESATS